MVLIRRFEEKVEELFLKQKLLKGLSHLSIGQEAVAVGLTEALDKDDLLVSHYRGHGHSLAKGVPPKFMMAEIFGKATGTCRGIGGSMHAAKYPEAGLMYATAIVGSGIPIAAGLAFAIKEQNLKQVAAVCFGDGAVNIGAFHEGMNIASIWKLPLVLICENNEYSMSMRAESFIGGPGIAARAESYGMPGIVVEGNDVIAVTLAARQAVRRAREGGGPSLLECKTYRMKGHGVYDMAPYRPKEEVEQMKLRDPIALFRTSIVSRQFADPSELDESDEEAKHEVDAAVQFAQASPTATLEDLARLVYKEPA